MVFIGGQKMLTYLGVSLPIALINKIDEALKKYPFSSRADFVKQACRRELERLDQKSRLREAKDGQV